MNPKSGKAGKAVKPTKSAKVFEADDANPGKVAKAKAEQVKMQKGKYGQTKTKPFKPVEEEEKETHWIEIELIDEADQPVAGEKYEIELPDGSTTSGTTDSDGKARVEGIEEAGNCKITFPELDKEAWEPA